MKNPTESQCAHLAARAQKVSLPSLSRLPDGHLSPESRAAFLRAAEKVLKKNRAVGASIILLSPSGISDVFCWGNAHLSPAVPVQETTCFRTASVSKLVMTFGTLALVERGLLQLDAPVDDLLGYRVRNPRFPDASITLRMLLTHTSGIRDEGNYGTRGMAPGCTLKELLDNPKNWLNIRPGASFHYSNLGAGTAGVLMERAAGRPFDDIMQDFVFSPLHIRASYDPRRIGSDLADGYRVQPFLPARLSYNAAALAARPPEPFEPEKDFLCSAGRMITNPDGMARLLQLLASHGEMGIISRESLDLMRTRQDGLGGIQHAGRGLNTAFLPGIFPGFSPVGHQGYAYGMCSELFADPQTGAGVGLMTNGVLLSKHTPPLMRAGFDLLALGFSALK